MRSSSISRSPRRRSRAYRISIDIDEFATGYSSLAYLHTFPLDTLKIDRSFLSDGGEGAKQPGDIATILSLASNLHVRVVAEGIETDTRLVTAVEAYLAETASSGVQQ